MEREQQERLRRRTDVPQYTQVGNAIPPAPCEINRFTPFEIFAYQRRQLMIINLKMD